MAKTFYTERDIEDLKARGVTSLVVNDDVVVTDAGRERARKIGFELVREHDQPQSAPIRPYIAKQVSPAAAPPASSAAISGGSKDDLQQRVHKAVTAKLGNAVDPKLLETIISRVLKNVGGS
ncbi:MAG: hypothetical protein OEY93_06105 [Anaerolineae bacterium]|nr:hypothetical protein [Anaerolineae bacterium]